MFNTLKLFKNPVTGGVHPINDIDKANLEARVLIGETLKSPNFDEIKYITDAVSKYED